MESREMPKYQSHKKVWALKIKSILFDTNDGVASRARIIPEEDGYAAFDVDAAYIQKHQPKEGGYYVVYDDGYKSWSPAEAFESGYTKI